MGETSYGVPGRVTPLAEGLWMIDLGFQERETVVTAYLIQQGDALVLVETGPSSTLAHLLAGIRTAGFNPNDLTNIFVSHIHLDHSGAAGVLLRDHAPRAVVHVHPVGLSHLVDPSKLVASAGRLYTDRMDELWGEVAPVQEDRVIPVVDDEPVHIGGLDLVPIFTPGHASHHIVLWDPARKVAFTGDVGGVRMPSMTFNLPPCPPPEVNPEAWAQSAERMRGLSAERLCLTHGGCFDDVSAHLAQLEPNIAALTEVAKTGLLAEEDHETLTARIHDWVAGQAGPIDPEVLVNLEWASPSYLASLGLTRLLVKRGVVIPHTPA